MQDLLNQLSNLQHWQIALLATWLMLQAVVVTIFPEEVVLATLGILWSQGRISFLEAWGAVALGLLPANAVPAFLGRNFGLRILKRRPFCWVFNPDSVELYTRIFRNYGNWVIFFTRFTPLIRGPIYFAAGVSQMGAVQFSRIDFLASCIQIPALILLGGYIGKDSANLLEAYKKIAIGAGVVLLVLFAVRPLALRLLQKLSKRKSQVS